jgi:hypothetical protein
MIDDIPEPRLALESIKAQGPLDRRSARVLLDEPMDSAGVLQHWLNARVSVAWPVRLNDDEIVWPILMQGELKEVQSSDSVGVRGRVFELTDLWSGSVSRPLDTVWMLNPDGSLISQPTGKLVVGQDSNRSAARFSINGVLVFVIENGSGLSWSVRDSLETISATAGLGLSLAGLPREVADTEIEKTIDLAKSVSNMLRSLLESFGLVIQRDITRQGGTITELRTVRAISSGRPIRINWGDDDRPMGDALKVKADRPTPTARLWIARAGGWRVESTFDLVGGWDPALEGQPDDEYNKNKSSNFTTYADVYRRWVLNEDGFYTGAPYNRGPAFDLTTFFGGANVDPQPLAFQSNLTLDGFGSPLKPIVEMSTDSGLNWSVYPKSTSILDDRAGVYLSSVSLPANFLTAAKAGTARVRVTASLLSPLRVEIPRWHGNAFTSVLAPLVFDLSDRFRFQRVNKNSVHYTGVLTGTLAADEVDHSNPMLGWLVRRLGRHSRDGRATLELAGAWPLIRPGDCLREVRGPGAAANGQTQALTRRGASVLACETWFTKRQRSGRTTRLDLSF